MNPDNKIRLRLRFYKDITENTDAVRAKFEKFIHEKSPDYYAKIRGYPFGSTSKVIKKDIGRPIYISS